MLKQIALGIVLLAGLQVGTAWADDALNKALLHAARYDDKAKVTEPQDKREAQDRLYAIEARRDKSRGK